MGLPRIQVLFGAVLASIVVMSSFVADADEPSALASARYKQCVPCHGVNGEGKKNLEAPSIAGLNEWYVKQQLINFKKGWRGSHPDNPAGFRMKAMANTIVNHNIPLLAEYVAQLEYQPKPPAIEGDAVAGKNMYLTCSGCHGADGRGLEALKAPSLLVFDDWYAAKQLKYILEQKRGLSPEAKTMYATISNVFSSDEKTRAKQIKDVVAYIETLKPKQ